jgi:L-arabinokinase
MFRVVEGDARGRDEVRRLLELLAGSTAGEDAAEAHAIQDLFAGCDELVLARAPGRLDLMGGIADYSGALVLEMPTREAALVVAARAPDRRIRALSLGRDGEDRAPDFAADLQEVEDAGAFASSAEARRWFARDPRRAWAGYVVGGLLALAHEAGLGPVGARLLLASDVPAGKGLSSSAAIEVAALRALAAVLRVDLDGPALALLAQRVENQIVGAPCGLMDQMTSACGEEGRLLALLCQPARLLPPLALPPSLAVWGIDSGVRHAVGGADYRSVRVGAFMGYRILAGAAGLPVEAAGEGRVAVRDHLWNGYLANVTPAAWAERFERLVPEQIGGAEFLARWGGITDGVTAVDPASAYAVRASTAHPIHEHARVGAFAALLGGGGAAGPGDAGRDVPTRLGELMYESHASYSACGLGAEATDLLVSLVRERGGEADLYGAKITGGGSGGTVAVLGRRGADDAVGAIAADCARETGRPTRVFRGSSPGATAFPVLRLRRVGG